MKLKKLIERTIKGKGDCGGHCVVKDDTSKTVDRLLSCPFSGMCHISERPLRYKEALKLYCELYGKDELLGILI